MATRKNHLLVCFMDIIARICRFSVSHDISGVEAQELEKVPKAESRNQTSAASIQYLNPEL